MKHKHEPIFTAAVLMLALSVPAMADNPREVADDKVNDRILVLIGEGYNAGEFWQPYYGLRAAGYEIDVVGPERGTIEAGHSNRDFDYEADLALDEVDISDYLGLYIPGGYSPANLEKYPEALDLVTRFMEADKPIGAVCHGPRLLARAGLLEGRVTTGLWSIKDEIGQDWIAGKMGTYIDQAVVTDDNLVTARYPWDIVPFTQRMIELFGERGGIEPAATDPRFLIVLASPDRRTQWALIDGGLVSQGGDTRHIGHNNIANFLEEDDDEPGDFDMLIVSDGDAVDELGNNAALKDLITRFREANRPVAGIRKAGEVMRSALDDDRIVHVEGETGDFVHKLSSLGHEAAAKRSVSEPEPTRYTAAIVLDRGFDDRTYAAMRGWLDIEGHEVAIIGPKRGWIHGKHGVPAEVTATFDDPGDLADNALIIAPGIWWPEDAEGSAHEQRLDWIVQKLDTGATVMAFGLDSLYLGRKERFDGKRFAAPDQVRWSFGGDGGRYVHEPAYRTDDRLITAEGAGTVADAVRLLKKDD